MKPGGVLSLIGLMLLVAAAPARAALTAPTGLTASAVSGSSIRLVWSDANKTENHFSIERGTNGTTFSAVGTATVDATTFTDGFLASGVRYYYRIRAVGNGNTVSPYSNVANAVTLDAIPPSVPSGLVAAPASCTLVNLSWKASTDSGGSGMKGYNLYRGGVFVKQVTTAFTSDTGTPLSVYTYTVTAVDNANNVSAQSGPWTTTMPACADTSAPSVPTGVTATAASCSQINVRWNASTDAGSGVRAYNVYRGGVFLRQVLAPATSTSDTGLAGSAFYTYTVSAVDNAGNLSGLSLGGGVGTPACTDATAPTTPSGLTATAVTCTQVNLAWTASTDTGGSGLKGYNVYRGGLFLKQVTVTSTSDIVSASATYTYTVAAVDNANNVSLQSAARSATTPACSDTSPPTVPTGLTTAASGCNTVNMAWNASSDGTGSGVKGYNVYRGGAFLKQVLVPTTFTSDTGLAALTTYSYAVSAVDNAGHESARTAAVSATTSACCADATAPTIPVGVNATSASCSQINLSWSPSTDGGCLVSGVKGYNLYRNNVFVRQILAPATSTADTGLAGSSVYAYTVSAVDNAGNQSGKSVTATTNTPTCPVSGVWAKRFGAASGDWGQAVAVDGSGNRVVVGEFQGTVDFGGGPVTSAGSTDAFVAKYTANGVFQWARRLGGTATEIARGVAVDSAGNVVVVGYFMGTVDFGGGPLTAPGSNQDIFVAKYSAAGTHLWSKRFGNAGQDEAHAVAVDQTTGDVVTTGFFDSRYGPVDFGGVSLNGTGIDLFVHKLAAATGATVWAMHPIGTTDTVGNAIAVDASGNVTLTGYFQGYFDFGAGQVVGPTHGAQDVLVAKLTRAGGFLWQRAFGGIYADVGYGITADQSGNVFVTGKFQNAVDFGGGSVTANGVNDCFVVKLAAATGTLSWVRHMQAPLNTANSAMGEGIAVDGSGNPVVTGQLSGTLDLGAGAMTSSGLMDVFVAKFAGATGLPTWTRRYGGLSGDEGWGVAVDRTSGNVVATGYFQGTTDLGSGPLTSAGWQDAFLSNLAP